MGTEKIHRCAYCNESLETGFLWGASASLLPIQNKAFVWFDGAARQPGAGGSGIPVGDATFTGSTVAGFRCSTCKKIILDYSS